MKNQINEYKVDKALKMSIARFSFLILVIINAVLEMFNMPIIPIEYSEIISAGLVALVGIWVGFRNNYLTKRGKAQAEVLASRDLLEKKDS